MQTYGVSPKVYVPLAVNVVIGVALVALGEREIGIGLLLAAASGAGFGYVASPGVTLPKQVDEAGLFGIVAAGEAEAAIEPSDASDSDPED